MSCGMSCGRRWRGLLDAAPRACQHGGLAEQAGGVNQAAHQQGGTLLHVAKGACCETGSIVAHHRVAAPVWV